MRGAILIRLLTAGVLLGSAALALPIALGFLGDFHPAFDSLAHFRAHLAAGLLVACVVLMVLRQRLVALTGLALAAGALVTTAPAYLAAPISPANASADVPAYRLLHLNLRFDNAEPEKALSVIARARPDVITLNEMSPIWEAKLDLIRAAYPHRVVCASSKRIGGVAILSRRPFAGDGFCEKRGRFGHVLVDFGGRPVTIAVLHLEWPWPFGQARQVAALEGPLAAIEGPMLVAGDLNAALWSRTVRRLARAGDLQPIAGLGPTWSPPSLRALRRWIGLGIDHVMAGGGIAVQAARTGDDAGSDHLPVIVDFTLPPARPDDGMGTTVVGVGQGWIGG